MIVFGHSRGLIVRVVIRDSPVGVVAVLALVLDGRPPHFQSLWVLPQMLGRSFLVRQILEPAQNRQGPFDGRLEEPRDVSYALSSSGVEGSEVSGLTGSSDESEPDATPGEFFASPSSEMNGGRASLITSRTSSGCAAIS